MMLVVVVVPRMTVQHLPLVVVVVVEEVACLIGVELAIDVGLVVKKRILSIIAGN
jgi:hypothetical protein